MKRCLAILLLLASCGPRAEHTATESGPLVPVQTQIVQLRDQTELYEAVGTVRPKFSATVSAKVMATIQEIPVQDGDAVTAAQTLAKLDDREMRAAFERAEADYHRFKKLTTEGVATASEFQAAEERYRIAKTALSYAVITAPFAGIVAEKFVEAGDMAAPGKALFTIEQAEDFRLEVPVPERFANKVPVGTTVHVIVEAVGGECDGVVGEVVQAGDPSSRSFLIKVDLHRRKPLRSGLFGRAQIVVGTRRGLFVPRSAVRERGQLTMVHIVRDGRAWLRLVKTGKSAGDSVEILSGLEAGEKIVTTGEVADGQTVRE